MLADVKLTVNGEGYEARVDTGASLLQLLRDHLQLTGTKEGCGNGECGACSVVLDGLLVNACLVLAVEADGASVRTIEGEAQDEALSDLQQAFLDHHALQCGFCTPGMVLAADTLLARKPSPTDDEIAEGMAGNVCRCTGYDAVLKAVRSVADRRGRKAGGER